VHVDVEFDPRVDGTQLTAVSSVTPGIWSMRVEVWFWLPSVAVTIAVGVLELVSVPVVAENVPLVWPDDTVTLEGTLSAVLLLLSAMAVLDVGAGFTETVHVLEALEPMLEGVQLTEVSVVTPGI
jgi:hypothetical protein